eukprot:scaffold1065_cov57-Phaeocystis_antarctica.AAC.2
MPASSPLLRKPRHLRASSAWAAHPIPSRRECPARTVASRAFRSSVVGARCEASKEKVCREK